MIISFIVIVIYYIGLKTSNLLLIIKGKSPVRRILGVILICQVIAICIVNYGGHLYLRGYREYNEILTGKDAWKENSYLVNIENSVNGYSSESNTDKDYLISEFVKDELRNDKCFLVERNFSYSDFEDDNEPHMIVSSNFLQKESEMINDETRNHLEHLEVGTYALIVPKSLIDETDRIIEEYSDDLKQYDDSIECSYIGSYEDGKEVFTYNCNNRISKQYYKDPIFFVIHADTFQTKEGSTMFWNNMCNDQMYYFDKDVVIYDLQEADLDMYFSGTASCIDLYDSNMTLVMDEMQYSMIEMVACILLAILIFKTMNSIYFEQFEKDLFIKRIAGMNFSELYKKYILEQTMTLLLGSILCMFLLKEIWLCIGVLSVFVIVMIIVLYMQSKREERKGLQDVRN